MNPNPGIPNQNNYNHGFRPPAPGYEGQYQRGHQGQWINNTPSSESLNRWGRRGGLAGRNLNQPHNQSRLSRPSVFAYNSGRRPPQPHQATGYDGNKGRSFHERNNKTLQAQATTHHHHDHQTIQTTTSSTTIPQVVEPAIAKIVEESGAGDEEKGKQAEIDKKLAGLKESELSDPLASDPNGSTSAMKMADDKGTDLSQKAYFTVGSQIKCRFQGDDVEGQVAAFNHSDRILMIRSASSCGKSSTSDFILINADCVDKISVEDPTPTENLKPVDFQKLEKRRQKLSANKKSRIRALSAGVPPEARKLFLTIIKTIDEVAWEGETILVLNEVKISPPYRVEDVQGDKDASVVHVKKIVDKHWKELASNSVST